MKTRSLIVLCLAALLLSAAGATQAAGTTKTTKLFKWVDKDGIVHYGSSIPPEYASQASEQLNSQGEVIKTQAGQKTPEQIAAETQAQQQAQAAAAQKAHDKVLLDTYTSVADMERDRDSKLSAIDAQINVLNGTLAGLQNTLAEYQSRVDELKAKAKPIPADLQKQIDDSQQQYVASQQQLLSEQQRKQRVAQQFVDDIARFQQLTGAPAAATAAASH